MYITAYAIVLESTQLTCPDVLSSHRYYCELFKYIFAYVIWNWINLD